MVNDGWWMWWLESKKQEGFEQAVEVDDAIRAEKMSLTTETDDDLLVTNK
jgi:hypothetical protein